MSDDEPEGRGRRLSGRFWLADQSQETAAAGAYEAQDGTLRLERELVPHWEETHWSPNVVEGDWRRDTDQTYRVLGTLDDGTMITLARTTRGSCEHTSDHEWQEFLVLRCFLGDHVTEETAYEAVEVVLEEPWSTWLHCADVTVDVEISGVEKAKVTVWEGRLVAQASPVTAEEWSRRVTTPVRTLLMLLSGRDVAVSETFLRRPDDPEVHEAPVRGDAPDARRPDCLIRSGELTSKVVAAWFTFVQKTVPVPIILAQTISRRRGPVEADVMVLAACAEAIHRELFDEPTMSRPRSRALRRKALEGLEGDDRRAVETKLVDLGKASFRQRLDDLVSRVGDLGDAVAGTSGDRRQEWLKRVVDARNSFAHMNRSSPMDLYTYTGEMLALHDSLRWLLTAVVLQHVGIAPERVSEAITSASSFHLFQEGAAARLPAVYGTSDG